MLRNSAIIKKFFFCLPLLSAVPVIIFPVLLNRSLQVFPADRQETGIASFIDSEEGGESRLINFDILFNKIIFTYTLKEGCEIMYAGISLDVSLLDISKYDRIDLHLVITEPAQYRLSLISFNQAESQMTELGTMEHFYTVFDINEKQQLYTVPLNNFKKEGYYQKNGIDAYVSGNDKPDQVFFIHLGEYINHTDITRYLQQLNKVKTLVVERISFHKSCFFYYIIVAAMFLFYYIFFFLIIYLGEKKKQVVKGQKFPSLPYIQLTVESHEEENLKKLIGFLKQNIFNPGLSITMACDETGISRFKISKLVKQRYQLSFKQLVDYIRLREVKRLLVESDLKIYDIAFKTGYNNYSYFCTFFKYHCGCTPGEYRSRGKAPG
jgi:AraC-like DNA-binding protein